MREAGTLIIATETGEATSNLMLDPQTDRHQSLLITSGFALSQGAVAMLDSIVTQGGLRRALRKAIGAIKNFDWTALQVARSVRL
jgi:hypothetical protein